MCGQKGLLAYLLSGSGFGERGFGDQFGSIYFLSAAGCELKAFSKTTLYGEVRGHESLLYQGIYP